MLWEWFTEFSWSLIWHIHYLTRVKRIRIPTRSEICGAHQARRVSPSNGPTKSSLSVAQRGDTCRVCFNCYLGATASLLASEVKVSDGFCVIGRWRLGNGQCSSQRAAGENVKMRLLRRPSSQTVAPSEVKWQFGERRRSLKPSVGSLIQSDADKMLYVNMDSSCVDKSNLELPKDRARRVKINSFECLWQLLTNPLHSNSYFCSFDNANRGENDIGWWNTGFWVWKTVNDFSFQSHSIPRGEAALCIWRHKVDSYWHQQWEARCCFVWQGEHTLCYFGSKIQKQLLAMYHSRLDWRSRRYSLHNHVLTGRKREALRVRALERNWKFMRVAKLSVRKQIWSFVAKIWWRRELTETAQHHKNRLAQVRWSGLKAMIALSNLWAKPCTMPLSRGPNVWSTAKSCTTALQISSNI